MFTKNSILIIPTKDRSKQLKRTLNQFLKSNIVFKKIVVIDSSINVDLKNNINFIKNKKIQHIFSKPSISKQRNIGIKEAFKIKNLKYLFFLDDDIIFEKKALIEINKKILDEINKN